MLFSLSANALNKPIRAVTTVLSCRQYSGIVCCCLRRPIWHIHQQYTLTPAHDCVVIVAHCSTKQFQFYAGCMQHIVFSRKTCKPLVENTEIVYQLSLLSSSKAGIRGSFALVLCTSEV